MAENENREIPEPDLIFIKRFLPEIRKQTIAWGAGLPRSADSTIGERVQLEATFMELRALNRLNITIDRMIESQDQLEKTNRRLTVVALFLAVVQTTAAVVAIIPILFK
jgi:hypothetical protein